MNKPTYEDMIKYASQHAKLLITLDYYAEPFEVTIEEVLNDGEIVRYSNAGGYFHQTKWAKTMDMEVLQVLPPDCLKRRLAEIAVAEHKAAQKKDHKEIQTAIDDAHILTCADLEKFYEAMGFSCGSSDVEEKMVKNIEKAIKEPEKAQKPKKARRKKKCPKNIEQTGE